MEYTILILLLPLLSFLFLGLFGMKLKPAAAGAVGTAVVAVVALVSYWTAAVYFGAAAMPRASIRPSSRGTASGSPSARRCTSTWACCWTPSR